MQRESTHIGDTLRRLRVDRHLSLATVAGQAGISVATLSRVETNKQGVDIDLLLRLARIFGIAPTELLGGRTDGDSDGMRALARRLLSLPSSERARVFRLSARTGGQSRDVAAVLDELVATVDALRDELAELHRTVRRRNR